MAFVVLLIAVLSRLLPPMLHGAGANVTTVGAGLLFFGAGLRRSQRYRILFAMAAMAATDYFLTVYAYRYPFHVAGYLPTWLWYGAVCLGASAFLRGRRTPVRVGVGALASSTSFFLLSNGMVWLHGNMYPHTASGLAESYVAGLPFYRNDAISTLVFAAVFFFLLPALAAALRHAGSHTGHRGASAL